MDPYGSPYFTLEATVAAGNTPRARGHIRWLVFRFQHWNNLQQAVQRPRLVGIGSLLSRLERLETIVLEYPARAKDRSVPPCLKAVAHKVHTWSSADARAYAKADESSEPVCDELPISPCYLPVS